MDPPVIKAFIATPVCYFGARRAHEGVIFHELALVSEQVKLRKHEYEKCGS